MTPTFRRPACALSAALCILAAAKAQAPLAVVSTGDYTPRVAPAAIASVFGKNLAARTELAPSNSSGALPTVLGGVAVQVNGRDAGLFFVSPGQINIEIPEATESGAAEVVVIGAANAVVARGSIDIQPAAPALFSSDGTGRGAGAILNAVTYRPGPFDAQTAANPGGDKRTRLAIYGTGLRFAPVLLSRYESSSNVAAYVKLMGRSPDGRLWELPVEYAGPAPGYHGLDQVNAVLPLELDGAGEIQLLAMVGGNLSNTVFATVRGSKGPSIAAVSPASVPPGAAFQLTGSGFGPARELGRPRSRVVFIPPSGREVSFLPDEVTEISIKAHAPPFSDTGAIGWYRGPVQVCVEVDGARACRAQPLTIDEPLVPLLTPGALLTGDIARAQSLALDAIASVQPASVVSSFKAAADAAASDLRAMIADAAAGRPRSMTVLLSDGPQTVTLDSAFFARIESILAATQPERDRAFAVATTAVSRLRSRAAETDCRLPLELTLMASAATYRGLEDVDDLLTYSALAASGVAIGACTTTGVGCALTPLAAAAWGVVEGYEIASMAARIAILITPITLDRIVVKPSMAAVPALGREPLSVEGIFRSALANGEAIQDLVSEILEKKIAKSVRKFSGTPAKLELVHVWSSSLAAAIVSKVVGLLPASVTATPIGTEATVALSGATLDVFPEGSPVAEANLACGSNAGSIRGLAAGRTQLFSFSSNGNLLTSDDAPIENGLLVRVYDSETALAELQLSPTRLVAGQSTTLTITLTRPAASVGAVISLTGTSPFSTLPASITIPAGQSKISIKVALLTPSSTLLGNEISAEFAGRRLSVSFLVDAAPNTLSAVEITPTVLNAGAKAAGTVRLSAPAPISGVDVRLTSSSPAVQVATTVRIPGLFTSAGFEVVVATTAAAGLSATVTAALGNISRTATVSTPAAGVPGIDVVSMTIDKTVYKPGDKVILTYTLRNSTSAASGAFRNAISGWGIPGYTGWITFRNTASLAPGAQVTESESFDLPLDVGPYKLEIEADYYYNVAVERGNPKSMAEVSFMVAK